MRPYHLPCLALVALVGSCAQPGPIPAEPTGWVVPAEYLDPARIQVGTFNIAWLWDHYWGEYYPRNAVDFEMIAGLIDGHDLDLLALQEIDGEGAIDLLGLPDRYSWVAGPTGWSQNPAILWRNDRLRVDDVRQVPLPSNEYPSKDLLVAEVEALDGDLAFTFVVVHFQPFDNDDSAEKRFEQAADLHDWLHTELGDGDSLTGPVVLAGDFNDTFEGIHPGWPSLNQLESDPDLVFATRDTDDYTELSFHSKIDHIALSTPLLARYPGLDQPEGCAVIPHDHIAPWSDYEGGAGGEQNVSNHRPVWIYLEVGEP
jgi:endonuclease/exonuclease/phosphatase family metal-dependent hydrolase